MTEWPSFAKTVRAIGYALVLSDVAWLVTWFAFVVRMIESGNGSLAPGDDFQLAEAGFTALSAPHIAIIPSVLALIQDLEEACSGEYCTRQTPQLNWFVIPFLALPFDYLLYSFNTQYESIANHAENQFQVKISIFQICNSTFAILWSLFVYWVINRNYLFETCGKEKKLRGLSRRV
jgi:hypothetical protein